ncbi:hypothetical protein EV284_2256 [Streptomyces sp. BK022]|uniref:hypothetical protein n=1 Tax=Streptomyces sp. BK022 TaxID=2512123 RepID=UPI00102A02C6|nr:hypothetical protein [Streptomyces sp. BK022]RZU44780.1 hypothetical protein EV284_2256 [Streptomyces sp. BK022]
MTGIFRSERVFETWHYTAAHGDRLLLRATAENRLPRIDLYVESVQGLLLETVYRGLVIREGTPEEIRAVELDYGVPVAEASHVHVIGEDRMRGFIVGGPLRRHEDGEGFRVPSAFGPIPGTP